MGVWCIIVEDCISPYKEWIFFTNMVTTQAFLISSLILTSCSVFKFLYFTHTPYRTIVHSRELKAQWTEFFFSFSDIFH